MLQVSRPGREDDLGGRVGLAGQESGRGCRNSGDENTQSREEGDSRGEA